MPLLTTNPALLATAQRAIEQLLRFKGVPYSIIIRSHVAEKPSGGNDYAFGTARPPQLLAISQVGDEQVQDAETDGQQVIVRYYVFTGRLDLEIEPNDVFLDDSVIYTVETVDRTSGFKTTGTLVGHVQVADG